MGFPEFPLDRNFGWASKSPDEWARVSLLGERLYFSLKLFYTFYILLFVYNFFEISSITPTSSSIEDEITTSSSIEDEITIIFEYSPWRVVFVCAHPLPARWYDIVETVEEFRFIEKFRNIQLSIRPQYCSVLFLIEIFHYWKNSGRRSWLLQI